MADQITLEEALELVEFEPCPEGWQVKHVNGSVWGSVQGGVWGNVQGNVQGDVWGDVWGTIKGHQWKFIETPKEKLKRLIEEGADKGEILEALDRLEDSNG